MSESGSNQDPPLLSKARVWKNIFDDPQGILRLRRDGGLDAEENGGLVAEENADSDEEEVMVLETPRGGGQDESSFGEVEDEEDFDDDDDDDDDDNKDDDSDYEEETPKKKASKSTAASRLLPRQKGAQKKRGMPKMPEEGEEEAEKVAVASKIVKQNSRDTGHHNKQKVPKATFAHGPGLTTRCCRAVVRVGVVVRVDAAVVVAAAVVRVGVVMRVDAAVVVAGRVANLRSIATAVGASSATTRGHYFFTVKGKKLHEWLALFSAVS